MQFPSRTPYVVRKAILRYIGARKGAAGAALVASGMAAGGLVALACLLSDRFVEYEAVWRAWGWRAAVGLVVLGVAGAVAVRLRRSPAFSAAVRLDQALPANQDRWATSLDLARRLEAGEAVGDPSRVARLFSETETLTSGAPVARLVNRRPLRISLWALAVVMAGFAAVHLSPAFDMPLLWRRLLAPYGNWPRDSSIAIRFLDLNGRAFPAGVETLDALPEESAFSLAITVAPRSAAAASWIGTPRLEMRTDDGKAQSLEFVASGGRWVFSLRGVQSPFSFRVRAGDGLTRFYRQPLVSRIRIMSIEHAIRYPGYSRMPPLRRQPLESERLSALEGAQMDFFAACDSPAREIHAAFEVFQKKEEGPKGLAGRRVNIVTGEPQAQEQEPKGIQRRVLKVTRTSDASGRFSLLADESGILRIEAVGTNGLPSRERACVIEAVRDAPPRISLTGIEPDTWIVPGEMVGYEYTAEDDLGVADLVVEWSVAGGAKSEVLSGEEYVNSDQFGRKVVTGREMIQRMNYFVYAQAPFVFRVVAVDTKGQEARSGDYRIHLVSDDFASRYEAGMKLLGEVETMASERIRVSMMASNRLNIVSAAVKGIERWTPAQDALLPDLTDVLRQGENYWLPILRGQLEFGDLPYRLDRSLAVLLAAERLLPRAAENTAAGEALKSAPNLSAAIDALRADLAKQADYAAVWQAAARAERARFRGEQCVQTALKLANRLDILTAAVGDRSVYEANVVFYAGQATNLVKDCESLSSRPPELQPAVEQLKPAIESRDAAGLQAGLRQVAAVLSARPAPPSPEIDALAARMAQMASASPAAGDVLRAAVADVLKAQGNAALLRPFDHLRLGRAWMQDAVKSDPRWREAPASAGDVWLVADQLWARVRAHRIDILAGRYDLDPARRQDTEAELREAALVLQEMLTTAGGIDDGARQALNSRIGDLIRGNSGAALTNPAADPFATLPGGIERAGRGQTAALGGALRDDFDRLAGAMEGLAARYDAFATTLAAAVALTPKDFTNALPRAEGFRLEAVRLQSQCEAAEAIYRNLLFLQMTAALAQPPPRPWEAWESFHGIQLGVTLTALNASEQVSFRFLLNDWKKNGLAVDGARKMALDLRTYAGLMRKASQGGASPGYDFTPLMKESRTLGHLESLKAEYEFLRPALRPAEPAGLDAVRVKVREAPLGRVAVGERVIETALVMHGVAAAGSNAAPATLTAPLGALEAALAARAGEPVPESLAAFRKRLASAAPPPGTAEAVPGFKDFRAALGREIEALRTAVRLPPVRAMQRQKERDRQMVTLGLWTIDDTLSLHDQRWTTRLRDSELSVARDLVAASVPPFVRPEAPDRLALDYAALVELRARQLSGERRRNQGIRFLEGEAGPRLNLPKHIADEFFRARNRKSPEQFKDWSEAYYQELYREVGR